MDIKKENEKKKDYLRGYRRHVKRIKRIESEIEELRTMKMYPGMNQDGMPHGTGQKDLSDYVSALTRKEDILYKEGIEQVKIYKEISYRIGSLDNEDERDVLFYRYIKGLEWWEIAKTMNYSERWIYELHGRALKKLQIF